MGWSQQNANEFPDVSTTRTNQAIYRSLGCHPQGMSGSTLVLTCQTMGKFCHSALLQFMNEFLALLSGGYLCVTSLQ